MTKIRPEPCSSCPYRRDVPSGVWSAEEYDKLRLYDAPTAGQPLAAFSCHASPEAYCCGWAVVHMSRGPEPGHPFDLLALRIGGSMGLWDGVMPTPKVELFTSGNEAADHGQRDVDDPSPEATEMAMKLLAKYDRLGTS